MDLKQIIKIIFADMHTLKMLITFLLIWNAIVSGIIITAEIDKHMHKQQTYQVSTEDEDIKVDDLELIEDLGDLQFDN